MNYRDSIVQSMKMLSERGALFIGQSIRWPGNAMFGTLEDAGVPQEQRIEFPVMEESQLGYCTGRALYGELIVCMFPRIDFMMRCMDQLVNHLDNSQEFGWDTKVIIRTAVGTTKPLHPGPQHMQDHTEGLRELLKHIKVLTLDTPERVVEYYKWAYQTNDSSILVEYNNLY